MMLYTKYESSGPCSFRQECFWKLHFENIFFDPVTYLCNQLVVSEEKSFEWKRLRTHTLTHSCTDGRRTKNKGLSQKNHHEELSMSFLCFHRNVSFGWCHSSHCNDPLNFPVNNTLKHVTAFLLFAPIEISILMILFRKCLQLLQTLSARKGLYGRSFCWNSRFSILAPACKYLPTFSNKTHWKRNANTSQSFGCVLLKFHIYPVFLQWNVTICMYITHWWVEHAQYGGYDLL